MEITELFVLSVHNSQLVKFGTNLAKQVKERFLQNINGNVIIILYKL